jgi:hypothetical protein
MEFINNQRLNSLKASKDKQKIANSIKETVLNRTGYTLPQLFKKYTEDQVFFLALKHITTTKKAICKALNINLDHACRYKRNLEKRGLLVQSAEERICPYTGYPAHFLSTNPKEFEKLQHTDQLNLF